MARNQGQRAALLEASRIVGSQKKLANILRISPARLFNWINRDKGIIKFSYLLKIEEVTKGQVTRYDFYPRMKRPTPPPLEKPCIISASLDDIYARLSFLEGEVSRLKAQQADLA